MRARSIKPGICDNELLGTADPFCTLLFERLWMMADREGRLEDRPLRIKAQAFPYREGLEIQPLLVWLTEHRFILRYTVAATGYIQVVKFTEHQSPHIKESPSKIPAPDSPGASTSPAPDSAQPIPALAALTPSSLTPDSGLLTADSDSLRSSLVELKREYCEQVFEHWRKTWGHPDAVFDLKRRKRIEARLKDFTVEQLCNAVSGFRHSAWHCGTDPKSDGKVYDGIDTLLRDTAQVEQGLRYHANPPRAAPFKSAVELARENLQRSIGGGVNGSVVSEQDGRSEGHLGALVRVLR